jgi:hypothetical protein
MSGGSTVSRLFRLGVIDMAVEFTAPSRDDVLALAFEAQACARDC